MSKKKAFVGLAVYLFLISVAIVSDSPYALAEEPPSGSASEERLGWVRWWHPALAIIVSAGIIIGTIRRWGVSLWRILRSEVPRRETPEQGDARPPLPRIVSPNEVRRFLDVSEALQQESVHYVNYGHLYAHKWIYTAEFLKGEQPEVEYIFRKVLIELAYKAYVRGVERFSYSDNFSNAAIAKLLCDLTKLPSAKLRTSDGSFSTNLSPNEKVVVIESILIQEGPLLEHIKYLQENQVEIVGVIILFDGSLNKRIDLSDDHITDEQIIRSMEVNLELHEKPLSSTQYRTISYEQL